MKREHIGATLWSILLSALISIGSVACLVTGFRMQSSVQISWMQWDRLLLWCCVFSVLFSLFRQRLAVWSVLAGFALLFAPSLISSVSFLLHYLSVYYDSAYGVGIFQLGAQNPVGDMTVALCAIAALTALAVSDAVRRKGSAVPALILSALPLAACLVCTDTLPDTQYIYMLLLGLTVLILTNAVRQKDGVQGVRLIALSVLPAALLLGLLFVVVPESAYRPPAWEQWLSGLWENREVAVVGDDSLGFEDLTKDGHYVNLEEAVMEVTSSERRTLYLRGQARDVYAGTRWDTGTGSAGSYWPSRIRMPNRGTVHIRTKRIQPVLYLPYYADNMPTYRKENADGLTDYTVSYDILEDGSYEFLQTDVKLTAGCELPLQTYLWAAPLAEMLTEGYTRPLDRTRCIVEYVRASAEYDLNTPGMPEDETDLARWFLEESETGYCVHYATAAAVLLRAAGIPARYVTGYSVAVRADEETTVRNKDAHAWVEVFISGVGWLTVDPTPGTEEQIQDTTEEEETTGDVIQSETTEQTQQQETEDAQTQVSIQENTTLQERASPTPQAQPRPVMLQALQGLCTAVLLVLVILAQWRLRVYLLGRKLRKGSTNRQMIARWKQAQRMAKYLKKTPAHRLLELAEKAKFSQHAITEQELAECDRYLHSSHAELRKKPWYCQLVYTVVFAVY